MPRPPRPIELTPQERCELERLGNLPTTPAGVARRCRAVRLMANGMPGMQVAELTGYTPVHVSRIRARFCAERTAAVHERARSGRPRTITARKIAQVVALTLAPPPRGLSRWSGREMARRARLAPSVVHHIWRAHALKPHQRKTFQVTTDPNAEAKICDIVGLYLHPPENAVVLCCDAKTQIQALSRTQPLLPLRRGRPARQPHEYRRNGTVELFAALDIATGHVVGQCRAAHTAQDFQAFLHHLVRHYPNIELHIIRDHLSAPATPDVEAWLEAHPHVHCHWTPTGASWTTLLEAWFSILTRKSIRRGSFHNVRQLVHHIKAYLRRWHETPTPLVWTKSAADVIATAVRPNREINTTKRSRH